MDNRISFTDKMEEPNQEILIHSGEFQIISTTDKSAPVTLIGSLYFAWFPKKRIYFSGSTNTELLDVKVDSWYMNPVTIKVDDNLIGQAKLTLWQTHNQFVPKEQTVTTFTGTMEEDVVIGNKSASVHKIRFRIPNMRPIGQGVYSNNQFYSLVQQLALNFNKGTITITSEDSFVELQEKLTKNSGFLFQHNGEICKLDGSGISLDECRKIIGRLNHFLSFLNGRRTSAMFIAGIFEEEVTWTDFNNCVVDPYIDVESWILKSKSMSFTKLWEGFSFKWQIPAEKQFIESIIYWYLEANQGFTKADVAIIISQTALELIFNKILVNTEKALFGDDVERLTAANKIRLILFYLQEQSYVPNSLKRLREFINSNSVSDAPQLIVNIRNSLVHGHIETNSSDTSTGKSIKKSFNHNHKEEALTIALWYIELALLKYFSYDGKYHNRTDKSYHSYHDGQAVPWS